MLVLTSFNSAGQNGSLDSITYILKSDLSDAKKRTQFTVYFRKNINRKDSLSTVVFLRQARSIAADIAPVKYAALAEVLLAEAYYVVNNHSLSFSTYKNSYALSEKYKDTSSMINSAQFIGFFYRLYGDLESEVKYNLIALKLSETKKSYRGISINSMYIGHSMKSLKRFDDALVYYKKAYTNAILDSNTTMIPNSLISIGNYFNERDILDSAKFYYSLARSYCEAHPREKRALSNVLTNLGNYYFKREMIDSATSIFSKSLQIARSLPDMPAIAYTLTQIGKLLAIAKEYKVSNDTLTVALEIAEKRNYLERKIEIYKTLAENHLNLKSPDTAYHYLQLAQVYIDSFYNAESIKAANGFQIIYESERKQNEILNLNILNVQQRGANLSMRLQKDSALFRLKFEEQQKELSEAHNRNLSQRNKILLTEKRASTDSIVTLKLRVDATNLALENEKLEKEKNQLLAEREQEKVIKIVLFGIPGIIAIVVISYLVFLGYKKNNKIKLKDAELKLKDAELKLVRAELKVGRLQINPHTILSMVKAVDELASERGYDYAKPYVEKLKSLMSSILSYSEEEQIRLSDELEVVQNYMELEKLRKNNFEYKFNISPQIEVDSTLVLPVIILPIIENSITHGFSFPKKEDKGLIIISIHEEDSKLFFSIEDNGIGRKEAAYIKKYSNRKSMGINITRERIENYNLEHNLRTQFQIDDLNRGVRVKFTLFKDYAY